MDDVTFQSAAPATPPAGAVIATDDVAGKHMQRIKVDLGGDGASTPLVAGAAADAGSVPVALSTEAAARTGAITETAPATDVASSGLNGRLQRIAQRLTSLIALLPAALGAGGGLKVDGSGTALPVSGSVTATNTAIVGATSDAAVSTDATGTMHQYLRGLVVLMVNFLSRFPAALGAGGGLKVDGSGTALPVSGTVTANAGSNLNTSALALDATLGTTNTDIGALTETAPATDTASSGLNGRLQRIAQRLTSLIALLPSALVGGKFSVTTATTVTPSWTDGVVVSAIATLARGSVQRSTIDLTGKPGMMLAILIGRTGTNALDVGIAVRVRRTIATSPITQVPGAPFFAATSDVAAAVSGVAAASGNNAGVTSLTLNAAKTFVAGTSGEIILAVLDSTSSPTTLSEWVRQAFPTSTTIKLLDAPTISAHNSTAHNVADKANNWFAWLEGNSVYEVIIDYSSATTGDTVVTEVIAQRMDSLVGT